MTSEASGKKLQSKGIGMPSLLLELTRNVMYLQFVKNKPYVHLGDVCVFKFFYLFDLTFKKKNNKKNTNFFLKKFKKKFK